MSESYTTPMLPGLMPEILGPWITAEGYSERWIATAKLGGWWASYSGDTPEEARFKLFEYVVSGQMMKDRNG